MNHDAIDSKKLVSTYKKNGLFDHQRKKLLQNFRESQTHSNLLLKLKVMVESKIKSDPSILLKNRGKTAALIQGEVLSAQESSILGIVDKDIRQKIIDSPDFYQQLQAELKDVKRKLQGISDEDYAKMVEDEEKAKADERARREREQAERDLAYKNNFKVKQLSYTQKVAKPPRFNFQSRDNDPYRRGFGGGSHLRY